MTVEVKVGMVPGRIQTVILENDATVADALRAAEVSAGDGYTLTLNGSNTDRTTRIRGNSTVLVTRKIKGNS